MPEDINNIPPQSSDPGFTRKSLETPILDSDLHGKINNPTATAAAPGGFKGFYKTNKFYFWAILLGIVIIGVLAYFAFRRQPVSAPKQANVAVNIDVPSTVASGGEAVYKVTLQNNDSQNLVGLQLGVAYPGGVTFESSTPNPQNLSGTLFQVPDLIPGQNAVVFIKARVSGNVNDQVTLDFKLHYKYNNFNSEFIQEQTSTIRLTASNVSVQLTGPASTNNAQLVVYTVQYQNNSDKDVSNARLQMVYPDGFSFASATPPPDLGSDTWNINTLAKGGTGTISIQGTFSSANPGESKAATANFLILGPDGQFFIQNSASFNTQISSLPLLVTQALVPDNPTGVIKPGDSLQYTIHYENNASTVATGVNIAVTLTSKSLDLSSITAQGGQVNNNTISWNASGVPQLQTLSPNQSGDLTFAVKVNNPAVRDASKNLTVVSDIQIKSNEYTTAFPGNELSLKISSPSSINTALSYASGQLPPQVGKSTVYNVSITLTNSSNDFSNGALTASIPLASGGFSAASVNSAEAANVQFDPSAGKLTWNFGNLPADTGRFTPPRVLTFQITLNPSSSQAGQSVPLLTNIAFTATDLFTGQNVSAAAKDISTSDLQGQGGFDQGQVQP